jgi:hypothetical protein
LTDHPDILLWNDSGGAVSNEFYSALRAKGYRRGIDYDLYYTVGPSSLLGNGIGGRSEPVQIAGYQTLLYTSGTLGAGALSNGDLCSFISPDTPELEIWLETGAGTKSMFMTGNNLAFGLTTVDPAFLTEVLGVEVFQQDVRPLIGNQTEPTVQVLPGNGIWPDGTSWTAAGGCPVIRRFDAVLPLEGTEVLAEFLDPGCASGVYPYAAATKNIDQFGNTIVFLPYDFQFIFPHSCVGPVPDARAKLLDQLLTSFGRSPQSAAPTSVPESGQFTVQQFPNPFNPSTKIEYNLPLKGELSVKVYSVRGELVKIVLNEVVEAGPGFAVWDGTDSRGTSVASGVYFYEVQAEGQTKIGKMALVK